MPEPRPSRSRPAAAALLASVVLLAGCGSAPERIDPSGIDSLVVPTPSVDPGDFDEAATNPWLVLEPGTARYAVTGDERATSIEVTVSDEAAPVAGVDAVPVRRLVRSADGLLTDTTSWYATDDGGNVWLVAEEGSSDWTAGQDGARAGLVMPAAPRRGDGFAAALVADQVPVRAEVLAIDAAAGVAYGDFDGLVLLQVTRAALPGITEKQYWARGVGLVLIEQQSDAGRIRIELVERTPAA